MPRSAGSDGSWQADGTCPSRGSALVWTLQDRQQTGGTDRGHLRGWTGWPRATDADCRAYKTRDRVNAPSPCPVCSHRRPGQVPGDSGTIHEVPTQDGIGKRISRPLPLTEGSPCALVRVDTASGLTRAFPVTEQTRLPPLGKLVPRTGPR